MRIEINSAVALVVAGLLFLNGCANVTSSNPAFSVGAAVSGPVVVGDKQIPLPSGNYLSAAEIRSFYPGKTLYGTTLQSGNPISISYKSDGTYVGDVKYGNSFDGKWWAEEPNKFCFGHSTGRSGCRLIQRFDNSVKIFLTDGTLLTTVSTKE